MRLDDKVAIVTGAAQGLGRAIALAMADARASVVLFDIQVAKLHTVAAEITDRGRDCLAVPGDVSSRSDVTALFEAAAERFDTVHILVNNAAHVPTTPADEERRNKHYAYVTTPMPRQAVGVTASLTDHDWLRWWDVNVHGVFYCTREALEYMVPQQYGRIINISSVAGISTASMHSPGYSASKAAVASLTKTVALDVAGAGVYVNAIACGGVLTPPFEAYLAGATEEQKQNLFQMIPVGRLGRPEEYASLAVYLATENHYLVGQVISANGGAVI